MFESGRVQPTARIMAGGARLLVSWRGQAVVEEEELAQLYERIATSCADAGGAPKLRASAAAASADPHSKVRRAFICVSSRSSTFGRRLRFVQRNKLLRMTPLAGATCLPSFTALYCQKARGSLSRTLSLADLRFFLTLHGQTTTPPRPARQQLPLACTSVIFMLYCAFGLKGEHGSGQHPVRTVRPCRLSQDIPTALSGRLSHSVFPPPVCSR